MRIERGLAVLLTCIAFLGGSVATAFAQYELSTSSNSYSHEEQMAAAATNPLLWQQYQALQAGVATTSDDCQSCGDGSWYDRCGCNLEYFPWFDGPGNCDRWCVGPKWAVNADGLFLFRDDANFNLLAGSLADPDFFQQQFDHGPGARLFVTGYNDSGFGLQIGYEGVNNWNASQGFTAGAVTQRFDYNSSFNSIEINFLPNTPYPWKLFGGFRYVELSEDFIDSSIEAKPLLAPADPAAAPVVVNDTIASNFLKNRLFGFQLGGLRDNWHFGRWFSVEAFANGGVYCNKFIRDDVVQNVATTVYGDDTSTVGVNEATRVVSRTSNVERSNITEIAFLGEAGLTGILKINQCVALRGGYQIMALDGVGEALQAAFTPGINSNTVVFHGVQFGLEYRR